MDDFMELPFQLDEFDFVVVVVGMCLWKVIDVICKRWINKFNIEIFHRNERYAKIEMTIILSDTKFNDYVYGVFFWMHTRIKWEIPFSLPKRINCWFRRFHKIVMLNVKQIRFLSICYKFFNDTNSIHFIIIDGISFCRCLSSVWLFGSQNYMSIFVKLFKWKFFPQYH